MSAQYGRSMGWLAFVMHPVPSVAMFGVKPINVGMNPADSGHVEIATALVELSQTKAELGQTSHSFGRSRPWPKAIAGKFGRSRPELAPTHPQFVRHKWPTSAQIGPMLVNFVGPNSAKIGSDAVEYGRTRPDYADLGP